MGPEFPVPAALRIVVGGMIMRLQQATRRPVALDACDAAT